MKTFKTTRGDIEVTLHFPDLDMPHHWVMMEQVMPQQHIDSMIQMIESDMGIEIVNGKLDITVLGSSWDRIGGALMGIKPGPDTNELIDEARNAITGIVFGFVESQMVLSKEVADALNAAGFSPDRPISTTEIPEEILQLMARDMVERNGKDAHCSCREDFCPLGAAIEVEKKNRNLI
jgi:hypothetical protein